MTAPAPAAPKPKFRGLLHLIAFVMSLFTGPILVAIAEPSKRAGTIAFVVAMTLLFGTSALYHRPNWSPGVRGWLRKLDHTMILVLIGGTFTPLALLIGTRWSRAMLIVVWAGAIVGLIIQFLPLRVPKHVAVIPYLLLGWLGLTLLPATLTRVGGVPLALVIAGGVVYSFGAIVYARRSPNPRPYVFGYHEIFHAAVVVAAYLHYSAIAVAVS